DLDDDWRGKWTKAQVAAAAAQFQSLRAQGRADKMGLARRGRFDSVAAIPQHIVRASVYDDGESPERLRRTYTRTDYALLVDHDWQEQLVTNFVMTKALALGERLFEHEVRKQEALFEEHHGD